ncbi:MAG: NAD(P)/FAD-dependent oxidoreductase [Candidatus Bathyarchaeia archaeon]
MNKKTDIIVVGAGPCGSYAAYSAAKQGLDVTVCENHKTVGTPKHCAGHLNISSLKRLGLNLPNEVIENKIRGAKFISPLGTQFWLRCQNPVTYVVDRELFDKHIAGLAADSGAKYRFSSRVKSLHYDSGNLKGAMLDSGEQLAANLVIDAEGCSSGLLKQAGLRGLSSSMVIRGIQAEVDTVSDLETDMVEVYFGKNVAPGFFAWIIPRADGSAKVGLATRTGNPQTYLQHFMKKHPVASKKLQNSKTTYLSIHPIPLDCAVPKTYANGFLAVGDAASQVKPTTGGGVVFGMTCAQVAGEVACEAVKLGDFSETFLSSYQRRWKQLVGFDLHAMLWMRRMLDRLSDCRTDGLFSLCNTVGIDVLLEKFGDLDFQGRTLIPMLRYPATLAVVGYFIFSSLTGTKNF